MKYTLLVFLLILSTAVDASDTHSLISLIYGELASIPSADDRGEHLGVAGAFSGVHNNALIIAGGANFLNGMVWEGGQKAYHDDIYILERGGKGEYHWFQDKSFSLPQKVAYGLTVPTEDGLVCIGGMSDTELLQSVILLKWNPTQKEIEIENLPELPSPFANMSGGKMGDKIYVAASSNESGQKYFASLDLTDPKKGWTELPAWNGPPRTHAVGVVQNNGEEECFYLFKGRYKGQNSASTMHADSYVFRPSTKEWKRVHTEVEFPLAAGTGIKLGANHILLMGGDDGMTFNQLEQIASDIENAKDPSIQSQLIYKRDEILKNHAGFSKDIWAFHTITQTWSKVGILPFPSQVTTNAFIWDDEIIIPSGEIAPSVRTPRISTISVSNNTSFGTINYLILIIYLAILVGIGFVFSKSQKNTEDFFKGGNRIPWWAAGLSIFGTQLSAITFMAVPAKTFATDWLYFFLMMTIVMIAPFIIRYFLPFYRRYNLTTAYEYLELRFNLPTRLIGSAMYIFLQLGRLGIVLLLPSLALSVVTGIDVYVCILSMGVLSILYTVLGGIEAVIWTDVIQVIVLLGGALLSLVILFFNLNLSETATYVSEFQKMRIFDFELSFSNPTIWVVVIGGLASNLVQYGSDQTVIQRYLTTKDEKSAAKGIMTGSLLAIPSTLIFFTLGTLLFVYYKTNPDLLSPVLQKTDAIFPWYIVNSLPDGISGLLIAAVFAASMSSLDSSMNSVSTVITTDYFHRLRPLGSESDYLKLARSITVIIGIIGTGIALLMATWGISSLWDQFNMIVGLFAGGLGGVFVLGIFSRKANGIGALAGLLISGILQYLIKEYTSVHLLMYAFTGIVSSVLIGYLVSLIFATQDDMGRKYTFFDLK